MRSKRFAYLAMVAFLWASQAGAADDDRFAGFPAIGKDRPGNKSAAVIASDPVEGLLRPKWTRAMADLGSTVNLYRYKDAIYLSHRDSDGHRGQTAESKNVFYRYKSTDEGRTWNLAPPKTPMMGGKYVVVAGDRLLNYWYENGSTSVQVSDDNDTWSEPRKVYKSPYWLYEVNYDPESKQLWCAAQSMASGTKPDGTWILRDVHLVRSTDGLEWEHVSTLPFAGVDISEADLRFEADRTMAVIVRRKWSGDYCTLAVARPPYTQWQVSSLPEVAEGHSFFEAGGQTFMGSRAYFRDEIPEVRGNKSLRYSSTDGVAYTVIHRLTPERKLVGWAVLDSMGDCSYPRYVETPTEILCAYYSEHEDNICKPYLAAFDKQAFLAPLPSDKPDFAAFPPIGKLPGRATAEPNTSAAVTQGLRPKWTRAMADGGDNVDLYRFGGNLFFEHRSPEDEATVTARRYVSKDEGRSWTAAPLPEGMIAAAYNLPAGDKLLRYNFDGAQSWVRTSTDGLQWTKDVKAYEAPFPLYGVIFDPVSKLFWCATNSVPGKGEQMLRLINSPNGIDWKLAANIVQWPGSGEAAMHFEADRTAVIVIRSGTSASHFAAWAPPPYTQWYLTERGEIAEDHSFATIGGRTFLATRAQYTGDSAQVKENASRAGERPEYLAIYRQMKDRQLQLWGVLDSMGNCTCSRLVETPTEILCAYTSRHEDGVPKPYLAAFDKVQFLRKR